MADRELNILAYGTPISVVIYSNSKLLQLVLVICPPCRLVILYCAQLIRCITGRCICW